MKLFYLVILLIFSGLLTSWNSKFEEHTSSLKSMSENQEWLNANLDENFANSQKAINGYLFDNAQLSSWLSNPNFLKLRFVLGFNNGVIVIDAQAIDNQGKLLGSIPGQFYYAAHSNDEVAKLNSYYSNSEKSDPQLQEHMLRTNEAYDYVNNWKMALNNPEQLNEIVSYSGNRIRYFFTHRKVFEDLITNNGSVKMVVLLGVNNENKLTTVISGITSENKFSLPATDKSNSLSGNVYDFCGHCPVNCD